jgi:predicted transcriptional regulator
MEKLNMVFRIDIQNYQSKQEVLYKIEKILNMLEDKNYIKDKNKISDYMELKDSNGISFIISNCNYI